ncbi:methyltransferase domain protein [Collimonas fungivorans]|uniref:Methyltransferase domain protein n=1 Tax=Collimonas fungivorans TaxID=158899 RepID=A0A127P5E7_9BURK|nr:class I SAM-dependent methyltransferase [Collimonas fungivorans]AMO92918.1 methyltransferase domain protein [Collimonas fungivorans]
MNHNPYECNKVPETTRCKCCGQNSTLAGLVDFSRCGADVHAGKKVDPYAGWPVYFYRCGSCGFTFTRALDHWQNQDFATYIYNDDYARHDPDYLGARPQSNADMILKSLGGMKDQISLLDYGSGLGMMADILGRNGFASVASFDPFSSAQRPDRQFNMVTCFEVFEHVNDPVALVKDISSFLSADGALLFSTLFCPQQAVDEGLHNWWYCAPRNGHISFYTAEALTALAAPFDLRLHSFTDGLHALYRPTAAGWLQPLITPAGRS